MKMNKQLFYGSLILLECLIWGLSNPLMKMGFTEFTPLVCQTIRFFMAFLIFMIFFGKRVFATVTRKHIIQYLVISAFTAGAFILGAFSLVYTTATNSGFLMSTTAIFTPFVSYLVLRSRLNKKHIAPILIVTAGLYLLCGGGGSFAFGPGELFGLLCAIASAGMLVYSSKYLQYMDPLTTSVMQSGFAGLYCLIFMLIFEDFSIVTEFSPMGWGIILFLAVGCTCIAYVLQNVALRRVSPTYAALTFCSEPIFTAIASYFILGEQLSLKGYIGAALIMASIVMASLTPEEPPAAEEKPSPEEEEPPVAEENPE
jgi:drug/metabolite transporter (DMT)-like permease